MRRVAILLIAPLIFGCDQASLAEKWSAGTEVASGAQLKGSWKAERIPEKSIHNYWKLSFRGGSVAQSIVLKNGLSVAPACQYQLKDSHLLVRCASDEPWMDQGEIRFQKETLLLKSDKGIYEFESTMW